MKSIQDITKIYLEWAPLSLAIREASRINSLRMLDESEDVFCGENILDVGCGDGRWWTHILPDEIGKIHGIDINKKEVDLAQMTISAQCLDITAPDFLERIKIKEFDLIIGNCSLEHIFHLDRALQNIMTLLSKNGIFILFVPTPYWALKGKSVALLNRLSPRISMAFSGLLNGFFQHWHLYNYHLWTSLLTGIGFKSIRVFGIGNSRSEFLFRLGLPFAFVSFLVKAVTGSYLNAYANRFIPTGLKVRLANIVFQSIDKKLLEPDVEDIFEYMIVCKK